ncbi:MAG: hypothetical protein GXP08_17515 [Gammaproteobacteria bacterium]|nr:hypothetical protein [Gammaproteobacteria bacterium]
MNTKIAMLSKYKFGVKSGLLLMLLGIMSTASAQTLIANSVPNLTTRTLMTVPAGQTFFLRSAIIAKNSGASVCCQRIFKNGVAVTGFMTTSNANSIQVEFSPAIRYNAGERVQVRNGASGGSVSFTLVGN